MIMLLSCQDLSSSENWGRNPGGHALALRGARVLLLVQCYTIKMKCTMFLLLYQRKIQDGTREHAREFPWYSHPSQMYRPAWDNVKKYAENA